jgi:hypothetical protein
LHDKSGPYFIEEKFNQWIALPGCLNGPVAEVHAGKLDHDPSKLLLLAIERNRITELGLPDESLQQGHLLPS